MEMKSRAFVKLSTSLQITARHAVVVVSFQASLVCCEREDEKHNGRRSDRVLDEFSCFRSRQCMCRPFGEFGGAQMTVALISAVYKSLLEGVGKLGEFIRAGSVSFISADTR